MLQKSQGLKKKKQKHPSECFNHGWHLEGQGTFGVSANGGDLLKVSDCCFASTEHTKEIYPSFFNARQRKDGKVSVCEQSLEKLLQSIVMKKASFKKESLLMIWS